MGTDAIVVMVEDEMESNFKIVKTYRDGKWVKLDNLVNNFDSYYNRIEYGYGTSSDDFERWLDGDGYVGPCSEEADAMVLIIVSKVNGKGKGKLHLAKDGKLVGFDSSTLGPRWVEIKSL